MHFWHSRNKVVFCQQTDTFTYLPRPESVGISLDFGVKATKHYGVFPKCFNEFSDKNICHYSKRTRACHPATSCVRDQDATAAAGRHMWETGSFNWAQFMLQWLIRFPEFVEFTEFNESSAPFRKNSNHTQTVNTFEYINNSKRVVENKWFSTVRSFSKSLI